MGDPTAPPGEVERGDAESTMTVAGSVFNGKSLSSDVAMIVDALPKLLSVLVFWFFLWDQMGSDGIAVRIRQEK